MKRKQLNTKWVSPKIICSYPNLAEPVSEEYGGKFTLSIPLKKNDEEAIGALHEVIRNAAINQWGEKAADLNGIKCHVEDCDNNPKYKEDPVYSGCLKFSPKLRKRPGLVYANMTPVEVTDIEETFYPGAIIRVAVSAYGTEAGGSRTVAFALNNVMFVEDGDRIGGGSKAEDDFADFKDESFDRFKQSESSETQDNPF